MTSSTVLRIESLKVQLPSHYGAVDILENVSLEINEGEAVGLVGESGSGKTLLGLATLGLLPSEAIVSGSVEVAGRQVVGATERDLLGLRGGTISLIYQDALSALNPNRRVGAHFMDVWHSAGLEPQSAWREVALRWCRRVALRDPERTLDAYPHELSGGMRQRVLIALALYREPRLVIADEPTTALDRATAQEILHLLNELQSDTGTAMLLISHDLGAIRAVCDRVAILYAGQLCELGPLEAVASDPRHRYTAALIESVESLRRGVYPLFSISGAVPGPGHYPSGCRFRSRCLTAGPDCASPRPMFSQGDRVAWCFHPIATTSPTGALAR